MKTDVLGRPARHPTNPSWLEKSALATGQVAKDVFPVPFSVATIAKMLADPKSPLQTGPIRGGRADRTSPASRRAMILQLNPTLPIDTPRGKAHAHLIIDPRARASFAICLLHRRHGGVLRTFLGRAEVRLQKNITMGIRIGETCDKLSS